MIGDEAAVAAAIQAAAEGARCGEMPIGAVVFRGDDVVARAWTQERAQRRRIVHADLLAMEDADRILGFRRPAEPLTLAVNLEPCLMCLGAAVTLGVENGVYALESPNDGGVDTLRHWRPPVELPYFKPPRRIVGGVLREQARAQFAAYAIGDGPASMRAWADSLTRG